MDSSTAEFQSLLAAFIQHTHDLMQRGFAFLEVQNYDQASPVYEEVLQSFQSTGPYGLVPYQMLVYEKNQLMQQPSTDTLVLVMAFNAANFLGIIRHYQRRFEESEQMYKVAMGMIEIENGPPPVDTFARTLHDQCEANLTVLYIEMGRWDDAFPLFRRVMVNECSNQEDRMRLEMIPDSELRALMMSKQLAPRGSSIGVKRSKMADTDSAPDDRGKRTRRGVCSNPQCPALVAPTDLSQTGCSCPRP
eukprot:GILJ01005075.1.p1 GENE.GILJ01005075.1~~GILJ01005075.1.p1  ORF type:complete len:248 (+),score=20.08 GILJ01005075.1:54-797(+)